MDGYIIQNKALELFAKREEEVKKFWETQGEIEIQRILATGRLIDGNPEFLETLVSTNRQTDNDLYNLYKFYSHHPQKRNYYKNGINKKFLNQIERQKQGKKIAIFLPHAIWTGGVKMIFKLGDLLSEKGYRVDYFIPYNTSLEEHELTIGPFTRKVLTYDSDESISLFAADYEIAVATHWDLIFPLYINFKKAIFYCQGDYDTFSNDPEKINKLKLFYSLPVFHMGVSTFISHLMENNYGRKPWVVPNGVNRQKFNHNPDLNKKNKTDLSTDTIKYIDLFAGMGGLRLGFEQALHDMGLKGESVFVSEIKKHAIEAYKKNFPNEEIHGDITQIDENTLPDFDYVLAGFPCQAFSSAGNRLGFEDTRGTLFFDVARIIKKKQPKGFLLENVEGLVTHDGGNTLRVILSTLEELGYKVNYKVLDSQNFGLAQSRKRIYIVGARKDIPNLDLFEVKKEKLDSIIEYDVEPLHSEFTDKLLSHYTLEDVIGKQIKDKRGGENNIHSWDFGLKGEISEKQKELLDVLLRQRRNKKWASIIGIDWMDGMPLTVEMISTFYEDENLKELLDDLVEKGYLAYEYPKKKVGNRRIYDESLEKGYNIITGKLSFEYSKILDPNGVTPTLVATDVSKLAVPVREGIRPLTTREGLKLFGFPDSYSVEHLDKTKVFDLLGNTVCVPVVKAVARRLLKVDF